MAKAKHEEKFKASIEDARMYTDRNYFVENFDTCHEISELWEERPKLGGDTDIVVVTAKLLEGKEKGKHVTETFNVLFKYNGTLEPNAESEISRSRRKIFARFLKQYITGDVENYSITENIEEWKGKKVEVFTYYGDLRVFVQPPSPVVLNKPVLERPVLRKGQ